MNLKKSQRMAPLNHSLKSDCRVLRSKDGIQLYYRNDISDDQSPVLFFLHGLGGDLDAWRFIRGRLLQKGFSSTAMDLRGNGYSDHPRSFASYNIDHLVEDVSAIIEREGFKKVILIGHCYGAIVALHFAIKYPKKLAKLVVISGSYRRPLYISGKITQTLAAGIANLVAFFSPKPYQPGHSKYPLEKFHKDYEWTGLIKTMVRNSIRSYMLASKEIINLDLELALHKIKTPTLVIVGDKDSIFPMHISQKIHKNIANSRFAVVKDANHVVVLNNAAQVADLIANEVPRSKRAGIFSHPIFPPSAETGLAPQQAAGFAATDRLRRSVVRDQ